MKEKVAGFLGIAVMCGAILAGPEIAIPVAILFILGFIGIKAWQYYS
jgi:hypothetical protein